MKAKTKSIGFDRIINVKESSQFTGIAWEELNASSKMPSSTAPLATAKTKRTHQVCELWFIYLLSFFFILLDVLRIGLRFMIKSYVINNGEIYMCAYVCVCTKKWIMWLSETITRTHTSRHRDIYIYVYVCHRMQKEEEKKEETTGADIKTTICITTAEID